MSEDEKKPTVYQGLRIDGLKKGVKLVTADETVQKPSQLDKLPARPEPPIDQPIKIKPRKE